jgi:uncharacterized protein
MRNVATALGSAWINRYNRDSTERRSARDAVSGNQPTVVITGASRGIGLSLACEFAEHGHTIVMIARSSEELNRAAQSVSSKRGARVLQLACDVTDENAWPRIKAALASEKCYLNYLVNNAATGLSGPFVETDNRAPDELIALNIAALTHFTRAALPELLARGDGGILNVASLGGAVPGPYQATYYASKAYVLSFTEALAHEVGGLGVRISALAPGPVETAFHADMGADRALYRKVLPTLTAETVARMAYNRFMLGQRVIIPGIINSFFFAVLRVTPHPLSIPFMAMLLKNPTRRK